MGYIVFEGFDDLFLLFLKVFDDLLFQFVIKMEMELKGK